MKYSVKAISEELNLPYGTVQRIIWKHNKLNPGSIEPASLEVTEKNSRLEKHMYDEETKERIVTIIHNRRKRGRPRKEK